MDKFTCEKQVTTFFQAYERQFNQAIKQQSDRETLSQFYAESFIAANPNGVNTGDNNETFQQMMYEGYKYYRAIGTQEMKFLDVSVAKIDELHVIAHTTWQATYHKDDQEITIPFNAHYLLQIRQNKPVIFGWITGDEQQLLQEYGII